MNIAQKIKDIRISKNLSQKEIALSVGIDRGQYSRIENGKVEPTLSSLEKISKALGVQIILQVTDKRLGICEWGVANCCTGVI